MSRSLVVTVALLVLATTAAYAPLACQEPPRRQGLWEDFGVGAGSLGCTGCVTRETGYAWQWGVGGTPSPHLMLGIMSSNWEVYNSSNLTGTLGFGARYYPSLTDETFVTASLGYGYTLGNPDGSDRNFSGGIGGAIGVGHDFRLNRKVSLTLFASLVGVDTQRLNANVVMVGLGVTRH